MSGPVFFYRPCSSVIPRYPGELLSFSLKEKHEQQTELPAKTGIGENGPGGPWSGFRAAYRGFEHSVSHDLLQARFGCGFNEAYALFLACRLRRISHEM